MFDFSSLTIGILVGAAMLGIIAVYMSVLSGNKDKTKTPH